MKKEKITFIMLLMLLSGVFGWIYEIVFYYINDGFKSIYLRGICFGPYIDIYVIGGLLIYLTTKKVKDKPYLVFLISGTVCGLLEYITGLVIYYLFDGKRSWNYNTEILNFGNINGFICLRSVLFFAISGLLLIYLFVPLIKKIIYNSKNKRIIQFIVIILFSILLIDETYNQLAKFNIINTKSASEVYQSLGFKYWKS